MYQAFQERQPTGNQFPIEARFVWQVDPVKNLLYVKGQVPGHKGNFVVVKDAALKKFALQPERPYPTCLQLPAADITYAPKSSNNPFEPRER